MEKLVKRLKALRKEKKLKKKELADILGVSKDTYSDYESGKDFPTQSEIEKLAAYFSVRPEYLKGWTKGQQDTPAEEVVRQEKDFFYKEFGYVVDDLFENIKMAAKFGKKQASNSWAIVPSAELSANEMKELLESKIKEILEQTLQKNVEVEVEISEYELPDLPVPARVQVSWDAPITRN